MGYEHMTYEYILNRVLSSITSEVDKREGSVIYDSIAPCCAELAQMYIELESIYKETFADTCSRDYLILRCKERGITPTPATKALFEAQISPYSVVLNVGDRFTHAGYYYAVKEPINVSNGLYKVECETTGKEVNTMLGDLIPVDYIEGLESAKLTSTLVYGEDEEETEHLRTRYFKSFDAQEFGGNKADYIAKTVSIGGVGACKVTPVWNGGGSVKLTILNSEYGVGSSELINLVQATIDPTQDGAGVGLSPIGHIVTVDTPTPINISVSSTFTFDSGYTFEDVKTQLENAIKAYILSLCKAWEDTSSLVVRISQLESAMLNVNGVVDVGNTTINGVSENLTISNYQLPVFEGVSANG